jgi:hypothetical protein
MSAAGASQGMLYVSPAMQAPCLSRQLPIGWFISQVMRYYFFCCCLEMSAAGASQGMLYVSPAMQAPCLSRHILRVPILRPLIPPSVRLIPSHVYLPPPVQLIRQSHTQHHCKTTPYRVVLRIDATVIPHRPRRTGLVYLLIRHL